MKYKVICKSCLAEFGSFDTPNVEMPSKCDKCGSTKIATVEDKTEEVESLTFDILLVNTRTNVSKRCGFIIPKETVEKNKKNLNKMRAILATEIANSLHMIVGSDGLLVDLLKQNE